MRPCACRSSSAGGVPAAGRRYNPVLPPAAAKAPLDQNPGMAALLPHLFPGSKQ